MNTCKNSQCQKEFIPTRGSKGFYCSVSCSNANRRKTPISCEVCKNKIKKYTNTCSKKCGGILRKQNYIKDWLKGDISGSQKIGSISSAVRFFLLQKSNFRCSICGWCEVSKYVGHGKPILTIDHIDGNWKNNRPENLTVLCYNCHTLTPTFGSLNSKINPGNTRPGTYDRTKSH